MYRAIGSELHPALSNLVQHIKLARSVKASDDITWITGQWKCVEGALRPNSANEDYAFIKTASIDKATFVTLRESEGTAFFMNCKYDYLLRKTYTLRVEVWFTNGEFRYGLPSIMMADVFELKRDPTEKPQWFILEHKKNGDVLMFRRDTNSAKQEAAD